MPRENVHWMVLQSASTSLPEGVLRESLRRFPETARIGSMTPDAPYYYRFGGTDFERTAEKIHGGTGLDTLEPVRRMLLNLRDVPVDQRPFYFSFIAGFLSHLATDIVFHPFIYAMTGNYYDPNPARRTQAQADHRLYEVFLDNAQSFGPTLPGSDLLRAWRTHSKLQQKQIARFITEAIPIESGSADSSDDKLDSKKWEEALTHICLLQRAMTSIPISALVRIFDFIIFRPFAPKLHSLAVLFLPLRKEPASFSNSFGFVHPATGEILTASIQTLQRLAVEKLSDWLQELAAVTDQISYDPRSTFSSIVGESLNTGLAHCKNEDARYFNELGRWKR